MFDRGRDGVTRGTLEEGLNVPSLKESIKVPVTEGLTVAVGKAKKSIVESRTKRSSLTDST